MCLFPLELLLILQSSKMFFLCKRKLNTSNNTDCTYVSKTKNSLGIKHCFGLMDGPDLPVLSVCSWIWGVSAALVARQQKKKNHQVWSLEGTGRNNTRGRERERLRGRDRESGQTCSVLLGHSSAHGLSARLKDTLGFKREPWRFFFLYTNHIYLFLCHSHLSIFCCPSTPCSAAEVVFVWRHHAFPSISPRLVFYYRCSWKSNCFKTNWCTL